MAKKETAKWVATKDALPPRSGNYLICNKAGVIRISSFFYPADDITGPYWGDPKPREIVAWMELPEPYEEDAEA